MKRKKQKMLSNKILVNLQVGVVYLYIYRTRTTVYGYTLVDLSGWVWMFLCWNGQSLNRSVDLLFERIQILYYFLIT